MYCIKISTNEFQRFLSETLPIFSRLCFYDMYHHRYKDMLSKMVLLDILIFSQYNNTISITRNTSIKLMFLYAEAGN